MKFCFHFISHSKAIDVALYSNIHSELSDIRGNEGIPYMRLYGVWARIVVEDADEFCRLYAYKYGHVVSTVRTYGGFMWTTYPSVRCLLDGGHIITCTNGSVQLSSEWYDGAYLNCRNKDGVPESTSKLHLRK